MQILSLQLKGLTDEDQYREKKGSQNLPVEAADSFFSRILSILY